MLIMDKTASSSYPLYLALPRQTLHSRDLEVMTLIIKIDIAKDILTLITGVVAEG